MMTRAQTTLIALFVAGLAFAGPASAAAAGGKAMDGRGARQLLKRGVGVLVGYGESIGRVSVVPASRAPGAELHITFEVNGHGGRKRTYDVTPIPGARPGSKAVQQVPNYPNYRRSVRAVKKLEVGGVVPPSGQNYFDVQSQGLSRSGKSEIFEHQPTGRRVSVAIGSGKARLLPAKLGAP